MSTDPYSLPELYLLYEDEDNIGKWDMSDQPNVESKELSKKLFEVLYHRGLFRDGDGDSEWSMNDMVLKDNTLSGQGNLQFNGPTIYYGEPESAKERKILEWYSEVQCQTHHKRAYEDIVPGTCSWLFDNKEYNQWYNSECSSFLWLRGKPGTGKTQLSSSVIEKLLLGLQRAEGDGAVAFFYSDRSEELRRDPQEIFCALLRQLSLYSNSKDDDGISDWGTNETVPSVGREEAQNFAFLGGYRPLLYKRATIAPNNNPMDDRLQNETDRLHTPDNSPWKCQTESPRDTENLRLKRRNCWVYVQPFTRDLPSVEDSTLEESAKRRKEVAWLNLGSSLSKTRKLRDLAHILGTMPPKSVLQKPNLRLESTLDILANASGCLFSEQLGAGNSKREKSLLLFSALEHRRVDLVKLLLGHQDIPIDIPRPGPRGEPILPIDLAVEWGDPEILCLIKAKYKKLDNAYAAAKRVSAVKF